MFMRIATIFLAIVLGVPMSRADDNKLAQLVSPDAKVEKLAGGMKFIEGPVWYNGALIFSDIPSNELKRWDGKDLTTFREPSNNTNGNTIDRDGNLISCEHSSRRVTITRGEKVEVLVDTIAGRKFNSPNDAAVKSDGTIWFTDPTYGTPRGEEKELDGRFVFRFDPKSMTIQKVATDFDMPNGICFSPDEKTLYVADSAKPHHIRAFDVQDDGTLSGGEVLCVIDNGVPDGIRCDEKGNIWSSAGDGVHIISPDGKLIGKIKVPESPANLCFGGEDAKTLFITARTSLYSIKTLVKGAR